MNAIERFFKEQDKVAMMLCGILLIIAIGVIAIGITGICTSGNGDDRPEWANDMASQLDEKGGRIHYYGDATSGSWSGATPIYRVDVSVAEKVYANKDGIIIKNGTGSLVQIPYDRVYAIYIAT